jgi:hypothetical protein
MRLGTAALIPFRKFSNRESPRTRTEVQGAAAKSNGTHRVDEGGLEGTQDSQGTVGEAAEGSRTKNQTSRTIAKGFNKEIQYSITRL